MQQWLDRLALASETYKRLHRSRRARGRWQTWKIAWSLARTTQ